MKLKTTLFGETYRFDSVRDVLNKAGELRSGDVLAGVAASSMQERVAAKAVLAELLLRDLRENPAVPYEQDEVTRIIQDDRAYSRVYAEHAGTGRSGNSGNVCWTRRTSSADHLSASRKGLTSRNGRRRLQDHVQSPISFIAAKQNARGRGPFQQYRRPAGARCPRGLQPNDTTGRRSPSIVGAGATRGCPTARGMRSSASTSR